MSMIEPGGLHWTVAGSGIVHGEVVEDLGRIGPGAQIFVRLPDSSELDQPYGMHFTPAELPMTDVAEGVQIRVVTGQLFGATSPVREAAAVHVYDVVLAPGAVVELAVVPGSPGVRDDRRRWRTGSDRNRLGTLGPGVRGSGGLAVFETGAGPVEVPPGKWTPNWRGAGPAERMSVCLLASVGRSRPSTRSRLPIV
ncbi:hypothetical protein [Rhodococcus sp. NCIMB 12038]|uniref:hypothetical protein n=1 Tax=Rhodococcus sp. NCIMB 12038 TaxID=933800 RepID=UPI000B566F1D|nr:hypothetical protein [Rhodococcus sp. NCIMB 12038]OUS79673.1 hypothetical protein CA951_42410 [Rhodococcus sp. NCIMB 12038]